MSCVTLLLLFTLGQPEVPPSTLLFDSGKEGYKRYRIPALLTTSKGTVLAFCEGRKAGGGLTGPIDIVLKRSNDGGKTWQPLEVVASDGMNTLGNPCLVVDREDNTIWLLLTRSHGLDTEEAITAGTSRETTRVLVTFSRDDGKTWAPPRDISATTRHKDWTWYGTGPGIAIQLKSGRLLVPSYHAEAVANPKDKPMYRSHMIYSDDHGTTWQLGASVGDMVSECQVAERADGTIVLSTRTMKGDPTRTTAFSKDGGKTWSATERIAALHDPACQANLFALPGDKSRWLFAHPAGPGRRQLTVRLSTDEGRTWSASKLLRQGDSQYSCLAQMPDGAIGCLYDAWVDGNYRLFFTRFALGEFRK